MATLHQPIRKHITARATYVSNGLSEKYKLNRTFSVMVNHMEQWKALTVAYDETFTSLRTEIGRLFSFQGLPALRVTWARQTDWNAMDNLNEDNTEAVLRLIWARGSKDTIYTWGDTQWPEEMSTGFKDGGKWSFG